MRGRARRGRPSMASEVEERRWPVRHLVREVGPHALHAVDPATGRRLNDTGKVTCEALQQTAGACRFFVTIAPRAAAGELYDYEAAGLSTQVGRVLRVLFARSARSPDAAG